MHEYGMVASLLEQVDATVRAHAGRRAVRVVVGISDASATEQHLLRDAFETFKAGSTASQAELVLEPAPLKVYCLDCGALALLRGQRSARDCPDCGSVTAISVDAHDMILKSVQIEV